MIKILQLHLLVTDEKMVVYILFESDLYMFISFIFQIL